MLIIIQEEVSLFFQRKRRLTLLKEIMKIFLTEIEAYGTTFAGPNIIATSYEKAEIAAAQNHLVVVGELDSIYVDDELEQEHLNTIPKEEDRTIH
jgi:Flp pilus assembly secretin CpaC